MERSAADHIRQAVQLVRDTSRVARFDSCDRSDLDVVSEAVEHELQRVDPSAETLSLLLNTLARSLRTEGGSRDVCMELDAAMRGGGLETDWEH